MVPRGSRRRHRRLGSTCVFLGYPLNRKPTPCVFLGYPLNQRGYKCFDLKSKKLIISRHVIFDETKFPFTTLHSPPSYDFLHDDISSYRGHSSLYSLLQVLPSLRCLLRLPLRTSPPSRPSNLPHHNLLRPPFPPPAHLRPAPLPPAPPRPAHPQLVHP